MRETGRQTGKAVRVKDRKKKKKKREEGKARN
jgi:hypothetical protein